MSTNVVDLSAERDRFRRKAESYFKAAQGLDQAIQSLSQADSPSPQARLSETGRSRIIEMNRRMWHDCPKGCKVKHRLKHPHMKSVREDVKRAGSQEAA